MIKVLIVDDSLVVQEFMKHILASDPEIQICGIASSGEEALKLVNDKRPDLITMDIHMNGMNGYEATRKIMETIPTPIVIVTGSIRETEISNSFKLMEAGALAIILRPPAIEDPDFLSAKKELIRTIKLMSAIKVVRRFPNQMQKKIINEQLNIEKINKQSKEIKLIAIGASTGGPIALNIILMNLPENLSVPIVIVQHIAKGFIQGLRDWLAVASKLPISIANDGEYLMPGNVYLAPDDLHMGISSGLKINLAKLPPENGLIPSVDFLFRSVACEIGANAIGVLLSGMGKDGAKELKTMKEIGAITMVQDEASCVVFGMPGEAVKNGAAEQALPLLKIAQNITEICERKSIHNRI